MTPREVEVLNIMERSGRARVRQVAGEMDTSVGYARHLLDYLTQGGYLNQSGKDTYQIDSKGIDAVIGEYQHTLGALERVIEKHVEDKQRVLEEIERLRLKKNERGK